MKLFHLFPLIALSLNFSGRPEPAGPVAEAGAGVAVHKTIPLTEDEATIPWRPERKLAWDDFLCAPQRQGDAVASTSTSLGISYQVKNGELTYHITCDFSKNKSWGLLKTDYILSHEQAHFDITELHARKLYQALYNYAFNPETFKQDIAAIYQRIVDEKEAMQEAYDSETDHSRRRGLQGEWLNKIDSMLDDTELFAAYP